MKDNTTPCKAEGEAELDNNFLWVCHICAYILHTHQCCKLLVQLKVSFWEIVPGLFYFEPKLIHRLLDSGDEMPQLSKFVTELLTTIICDF